MAEALAATVTAASLIIAALLGLCGVLVRRNNRNHKKNHGENPGYLQSSAFHERMNQQGEISRENHDLLLGVLGELKALRELLDNRLPRRGGD